MMEQRDKKQEATQVTSDTSTMEREGAVVETAHYAARVLPPRIASRRDMAALQTMMANLAIDEQHPVALELVGSTAGTAFLIRASSAESFSHLCDQMRACYPQATIESLARDDDPLFVKEHEMLAAAELCAGAAPYLSLRTFDNHVWEGGEGADPIVHVLSALSHLPSGTRVIAQLAMLPARSQWSHPFWRKAVEHPLEPERKAERKKEQSSKSNGPSVAALLALAAVIGSGLLWRSFGTRLLPLVPRWLQQDVSLLLTGHVITLTLLQKAQLVGMALVLLLFLLCIRSVAVLIRKSSPLYNMRAVGDKTKQVAYRVRVRLIVISEPKEPHKIGKERAIDESPAPSSASAIKSSCHKLRIWASRQQARWRTFADRRAMQRALLARLAAAYRQYHQASAGYFLFRRLRTRQARRIAIAAVPSHVWFTLLMKRVVFGKAGWERGVAGSAHYLSIEELAALWHLPPEQDISEVPLLEHGRARTRLVPSVLLRQEEEKVEDGSSVQNVRVRVGISEHAGYTLPVFLPDDCYRRNLLAVAKTGKGKSTLLVALSLGYLMAQTREGLLFMEPHGDTIASLLGHIPTHRQDDVTVIDLSDQSSVVGLNPLDMTQGRDRDKTVENLLSVFIAFWKQQHSWGPRTENVLHFALLTLCEANERKVLLDEQHGPDEQYTLLDVIPLLRDISFRHRVLEETRDLALHEWWQRYYEVMEPRFQNEVIAPVLNKISRYSAERLSRRILGQARSTVRLRDEIAQGNILLINTASGKVGAEVSALLGATMMGLFHLALAEQAHLAQRARRRFLVLIDEFQTYTGIDYNTMLAELRKYGGTFGLATQSLSYLDEVDASLRATVLSNIDHLFAFLMSAEDARTILPNLDGLLVDDILNLDDYTCYAKLSCEGKRLPTFSLKLDPPSLPDEDGANRLRDMSRERNARPVLEVDEALFLRAKERVLVSERDSVGRARKTRASNAETGVGDGGTTNEGEHADSADSEHTATSARRRKRGGGGNRSTSGNREQNNDSAAQAEQRNNEPSPAQSTPLITSSDAGFGHMLYDQEEPRE